MIQKYLMSATFNGSMMVSRFGGKEKGQTGAGGRGAGPCCADSKFYTLRAKHRANDSFMATAVWQARQHPIRALYSRARGLKQSRAGAEEQ